MNCEICQEDAICTECKPGYYLKNKLCSKCPASRENCTYSEFTKLIDGDCSLGFFYNKSTLSCNSITIENCMQLDDTNTDCIRCSSGYRLTFDGYCVPACIPNCLTCSSPYTCDVCQENYINIASEECRLNCTDNCAYCFSDGSCKKCTTGYTL